MKDSREIEWFQLRRRRRRDESDKSNLSPAHHHETLLDDWGQAGFVEESRSKGRSSVPASADSSHRRLSWEPGDVRRELVDPRRGGGGGGG